MPITEINNTMPSFTEWFEAIGYNKTNEFRQEDNTKRDRLEFLFQNYNIPYDRPERMTARDIVDCTPLFQDIINRKGNELCALRLVPTKSGLPKLRQRGKTLNEYLGNWFNTLDINPDDYKVEVVPHSDETKYSATFIISDKGIIGEFVAGGHWQLTQGFFSAEPISFLYDWNKLVLSKPDEPVADMIKTMLDFLHIPKDKQNLLKTNLNAKFTNVDYLQGYFEYIIWPGNRKMFVDYNRLIPDMIGDVDYKLPEQNIKLTGICASPGIASGKVKIVLDPTNTIFGDKDILVCRMTMIDYVPLMKKASGIITEEGNILSHAAIVSREMKIPCIVGVKNVLVDLKDGDEIEMDAMTGKITIKNR
ncbi:MAG TPA: hypothetical protein DEB09_02880 [Candidatus Magasanikbacteria bacterium]|nr:hypothetical protein [Candidatus Magasanikbacteria bacterium]